MEGGGSLLDNRYLVNDFLVEHASVVSADDGINN